MITNYPKLCYIHIQLPITKSESENNRHNLTHKQKHIHNK